MQPTSLTERVAEHHVAGNPGTPRLAAGIDPSSNTKRHLRPCFPLDILTANLDCWAAQAPVLLSLLCCHDENLIHYHLQTKLVSKNLHLADRKDPVRSVGSSQHGDGLFKIVRRRSEFTGPLFRHHFLPPTSSADMCVLSPSSQSPSNSRAQL